MPRTSTSLVIGLALAVGWPFGAGADPTVEGQSPPPGAAAKRQIYQWTDTSGTLHVTEDPGLIPDEYRDKAVKRDFPRGIQQLSGPAPAHDDETPFSSPPAEAPYVIPAAKTAGDWQGEQQRLVQLYKSQLRAIEDAARQLQAARIGGAPPGRIQADLDTLKSALASAKDLRERLQNLKDRCRREGGNDNWVKSWQDLGLPDLPEFAF